MFGWFRRKPSAYAVAIRDSMTKAPGRWATKDIAGLSFLTDGQLMVETESCYLSMTPTIFPETVDRRCIREGIEAWVAWSVRAKEPTDAQQV